jgi:predicted dehydrogenase/NADPH:quinone reductase-like Zn-dependent oxidoreductase
MKQVLQDIRAGHTFVHDVPDPIAAAAQVVVATAASLISAGTERYVVELARKSLLGKARDRPDHVRRVLQKVRQEGLLTTAQQVFAKLDEPMSLGYSSAGTVLECGREVHGLAPGDRVAMAAPHASIVAVGANLCAKLPEGVSFEQAAYTSVAAIALEGVRLARVTLGERVLVIGLGLIGQITVALLKAQGCKVIGCDLDPARVEQAKAFGADVTVVGDPRSAARTLTTGNGVDAVLITAATESNGPIETAAEVARVRGRIVLVGVAGLSIPRPPFFAKELEFTVSGSLGPGRNDESYEQRGIDYPFGHVRWTVQRNMEAVLDTIAAGKLPVERLTTHHFPIVRAAEAYDLVIGMTEPYTGIVLDYDQAPTKLSRVRSVSLKAKRRDELGISMVGSGNYTRLVLMPLLKSLGGVAWRHLTTARGVNAQLGAERMGFAFASTDVEAVFADEGTDAVIITTRHDLHADLVVRALEAGKHVFVEKPLCIRLDELRRIRATVERLGESCPVVMVGFNRRWSPSVKILRDFFKGLGPLTVTHRFSVPPIPSNAWPQVENVGGGRVVGEASHAIDTCSAIAGSDPVLVNAMSIGRAPGVETTDDRVAITMRHENGSLSSIVYDAGGDRAAPPERLEVFGGGRTAHVDQWGDITLWSGDKKRSASGGRDKGQAEEFSVFISACRGGPIGRELFATAHATTLASLAAVHSLRTGMPVDLTVREPTDPDGT